MGVSHLLLRRQWLSRHPLDSKLTRCIYTLPQLSKQLQPSPSELLRFVLRDSTEPGHNSSPTDALPAHLREIFNTEWRSSSPPQALWCSLRGLSIHPEKEEIIDVPSLRSAIERYVNDKNGAEYLQEMLCAPSSHSLQIIEQRARPRELLSVFDDLLARLHRLQLPVKQRFYSLCIGLAMRDLSVSAIRRFLNDERYKGLPPVDDLEQIMGISTGCSQQLDSKTFEDPSYDRRPMLAEITGEGDLSLRNCVTLHDTLRLRTIETDRQGKEATRYNALYLCLLAKLGSDGVLQDCWAQLMKGLISQDRSGVSQATAYQVVLVLVQSGRSKIAAKFLEDVSQIFGDNLPKIAKVQVRALQVFLDDPIICDALPDLVRGEDYLALLEVCLTRMDQRMGIQWDPESQSHFSTALEPSDAIWEAFDEQTLPVIDRQRIASGHSSQLYAELQVNGCSKSPAALGRIVDLLHDHDGQSQEIITHLDYNEQRLEEFRDKFESLELQWTPEYSPIEFSNSRLPALHDSSVPRTPSTLGLIRARLIVDGVPQMGINALHLMQLGCMDMRYSPDQPWQPSGYTVVWDRHYNELLALYVGNGNGVIDCGPAPANSPFGALMHIKLPTDPDRMSYSPLGTSIHARNCYGPYYLDVDPSPDLMHQPRQTDRSWACM